MPAAILPKKHIWVRKNNAGLKVSEQLEFINQLQKLTAQGFTLLDALKFMEMEKGWRNSIHYIRSSLQNGARIDEAFEQVHFHQTIVSSLYFAHYHGNLGQALKSCYHSMSSQMKHLAKFKQVSRYPLMLLTLMLVLLLFIKLYVYPSFLSLFAYSAGSASLTAFFIHLTNYFIWSLLICSLLILLLTFSWHVLSPRIPISYQLSLFRRIPIFQQFVRLRLSFQFAIHFASLLQTGQSFKDVLQILASQSHLPAIKYNARRLLMPLQQGQAIGYSATYLLLMDRQLIQLITSHANLQELQIELTIYAELTASKLEQKIKRYLMLVQPLLLIIMAGFILFIYLSLMLPMFRMVHT